MPKKSLDKKLFAEEENMLVSGRVMLPDEWSTEKKVDNVIVAGAFAGKLKELVLESEFDSRIKSFLEKKSD